MIDLTNWFSGIMVIPLFIKAFAVVFALMYVLFAIVIYKQTQIMVKTVQSSTSYLILLGSMFQIIIGIILLIWALML